MKIIAILLVFLGVLPAEAAKPFNFILNWKPEAEFGGFYQAEIAGEFKKQGLEVEIQPGGVGTPSVQMVAAGSAEFGVASADEIILSQDRGTDVTALFTVYHTSPMALMTSQKRGAKSIEDLFKSGTLAIQKGLPFFLFLERKFPNSKTKIVPFLGGVSQILKDPTAAQQGFITSEPIVARKQGLIVDAFLIADAGYNPYTEVVVAKKSFIEKNPEVVKKFLAAITQGWKDYLVNPTLANKKMNVLNPTMDLETLKESADIQKRLIENKQGLGTMTLARWKELSEQLLDLKLIKKVKDPKAYFFTPK
jgi:NitT/TauT family transport system substrate-binding protein